jgi:hypothetical protein
LKKVELKRDEFEAFTQEDFELRDPIDEYQLIKKIEDDVLYFNERLREEHVKNFNETNDDPEAECPPFKPLCKTYVISAGILYGRGEAIFNQHLKQAWK